jgi:transcriptional regulator with XRE-family HTH domain
MVSRMTIARSGPVDRHVGARIRLRRRLRGLSMEKLGRATGVTYQQLQKYETGANRVSASRLHQLAKVLGVPISFFFDELPPEVSGRVPSLEQAADPFDDGLLARRVTLELVHAYHNIPEAATRRGVYKLVKALAETAAAEEEQGAGRRAPGKPAKQARRTTRKSPKPKQGAGRR